MNKERKLNLEEMNLSHAENGFVNYTIRSLIPDLQYVDTVSSETPIKEAIGIMCDKEYSQLPVLDDGKRIISITFESIIRKLRRCGQNGKVTLEEFLSWPVKAVIDDDVREAKVDDHPLDHIKWMANKNFVLVVDPAQELKAIVTNYDFVLFLKKETEAFLLLREIETALRFIVRQKLQDQELKEALCSFETEGGSRPSRVDELTLYQLRQLILKDTIWIRLSGVFVDKKSTNERLEKVCNLRNQILHFKDSLTASDLAFLKRARDIILSLAKTVSTGRSKN